MTKRVILVLLALLTAVGTAGCSIEEWLDEQIAYSYTVEFSLDDEGDRERLARRLEALDFEIVSTEQENIYMLEGSYVFPDDFFEFVLAEHKTSLVDEHGNVLLTAADISGISCDDISLDAKISKETAAKLEEAFSNAAVLIDDSHETFEAEAYCYEKNDEHYVCITAVDSDYDFDTLNEAEMALFGLAISLTGEEFDGEITGNVTERDQN